MNETEQPQPGDALPSQIQEQLKVLIFDLDGVITSEKKYWNTARLTVWEIISSHNYLGLSHYFIEDSDLPSRLPQIGEQIIPSHFIYELKSRAINSNWDLTFFVVCLHLVGILSEFSQVHPGSWSEILSSDNIPIEEKLQQIGKLLQGREYDAKISEAAIARFWQETRSLTGLAVLDHMTSFASQILRADLPSLESKADLWQLCYHNFQEWYEGRKGYTLPDDETVLDLTSIDAALKSLHNSGRYTLAIATGRPRIEVLQPLTALELLQYFDPKRIVTYDEVLDAESVMSHSHRSIKLGKPHPFVLLKALYPDESAEVLCAKKFQPVDHKYAAYIGDAASDVVAAKQAGCISIGVLTGFAEGKILGDLGCDLILNSVLELPQLLGVQRN